MVCFNPKNAWKLNFNSLDVAPYIFEKQKKLTFKKPTNEENYTQIQIPCGNCLGCKLDLANEWSVRIMLETYDHKENSFITLTYNKKNLPINEKGHMTLLKKDIQDFIKRLRFSLNNQKITYFACGEYGSKTFRPHAHLIIFGYKPKDLKLQAMSKTDNEMYDSKELSKIWGKGFVCIQDVNYKTACYTARYVQKKAGITPTKRKLTGEVEEIIKIDERNGQEYISSVNKTLTEKFDKYDREKEFIIMSKNPAIGLNYWKKNKEKIKRNGGILIKIDDKTILKPIPRYFKKLWEKENWEELYKFKYKCQKDLADKQDKILKKISTNKNICKELTEDDKTKIINNYLKKNLTERGKYLKREQI